jgi:DNA-binding Lrp family transcriptional regulator
MNKLIEIPEIVDNYIVQGRYDIIAKVKLNTEEELKELFSERIRKVIRVTGTVTVIIAKDNSNRTKPGSPISWDKSSKVLKPDEDEELLIEANKIIGS